jgi:hypothetical protein
VFISVDPCAMMPPLAVLTAEGWRPGVGDPTFIGWLIVGCYFTAAILCAWALHVAKIGATMAADFERDRRFRDRSAAYRASFRFWALLAGACLLLGVNKQLDLQTWLTEVGRNIATEQGWIHERRRIQSLVVGLIALGGLSTLGTLLYLTRELLPRHVLAFVGTILMACFLLGRTVSFHHLDVFLNRRLLGVEVVYLLELAGIACVVGCAVMNCWWYKLRPAATSCRQRLAAPLR